MKPSTRPGATAAQPALRSLALRQLARREHTRAELARKLAGHAPDPAALEDLLDSLQAQGWLCDERYAESRVRQRAAGWGNHRLQADLQSKGVGAGVAEAALAQAAGDEPARAQAWWERRFGQAPLTAQDRARQWRHMLARGFSAEVVRRVVPRIAATACADDCVESDTAAAAD